MKQGHYEPQDCPSYAGNGLCKFKGPGRCSYSRGNHVCSVNGCLEGLSKVKTQYEASNDVEGFKMFMNGVSFIP